MRPMPIAPASHLRRTRCRPSVASEALAAPWSGLMLALAVVLAGVLVAPSPSAATPAWTMPWAEAGLDAEAAAVHLLDRFAYGPRPGQIEALMDQGFEVWFEEQLAAAAPPPAKDPALEPYRQHLDAWSLSPRQIVDTFPPPPLIVAEARREGVLSEEDMAQVSAAPGPGGEPRGNGAMRSQVMAYAREKGYRSQRELMAQLQSAKLVRALDSPYPLGEVMTDFWFNHFNVSTTDNEARVFVLPYERDAVRPFVTGSFRQMLEAVARHPAMLLYLDNARSVAPEGAVKTFDGERATARRGRFGGRGGGSRGVTNRRSPAERTDGDDNPRRRRATGINENYARELLELHTLGVDGGYTQRDVEAVARAFTGWGLIPPGAGREQVEDRLRRSGRRAVERAGFVVDSEGLFLFRADAHDAGEKVVLGQTLPAGRGMEDGLEVLDLVAAHPATARHLARKLAVRFVSDEPPGPLVDRLAAAWSATEGDISSVLRVLVASPEFWGSRGEKIKSPFGLAVSALRALDADLLRPEGTLRWISRLGEPLYAYQAPTGYPDSAATWVNSGSLLSRMNFGLELAAGEVDGVRVDLLRLNDGREPESPQAALERYFALLLPQRESASALARLEPMVRNPDLGPAVESALDGQSTSSTGTRAASKAPVVDEAVDNLIFGDMGEEQRWHSRRRGGSPDPYAAGGGDEAPPSALEQVVGVILGSPEFQRR